MADQIAISFQSSGVKSATPKGVSGNPGNPLKSPLEPKRDAGGG